MNDPRSSSSPTLPCLAASHLGRQWDGNQQAPYFNTVEEGATVQYWYDDAQSLRLKYAYARTAGLRGVGPYTYGDVPLSDAEMWRAFDAFLSPSAVAHPPLPARAAAQ